MRNDNLTPEEVAEDRDRFYIYTDFEEQLEMLTHEQIGRAFLALYHYFHTGEKQVQEREVNMMLASMTSKLDRDTRYYARKVEERRQRASNAGKASVAARRKQAALAKALEEFCEAEGLEPDIREILTSVNTCALNQPDKEKEKDNEKEKDKEKERDNDNDKENEEENKLNYYYYSSSKGAEEPVVDNSTLIPYGREQHLTTKAEIEKIHALADELIYAYRGKKPTPDDYEKVFAYVHTIAVSEDGEHYGIYSAEKADLLRHVFEQAALRSDMNWQYMNRIYINYEKNNVHNVEQAIEYECRWNRKEDTKPPKEEDKEMRRFGIYL